MEKWFEFAYRIICHQQQFTHEILCTFIMLSFDFFTFQTRGKCLFSTVKWKKMSRIVAARKKKKLIDLMMMANVFDWEYF